MFKKFLSFKSAILAIIISLTLTLFIGCFANAPLNMDESFNGKYWHYLNRGYPEPWAGVGLANSKVDFPLVRMPFLSAGDGRGIELVKIINLNTFISIFIVTFLIAYIPSFILAKAVDENKKLFPFFRIANIVVFAIGLFVYFSWFSRV